MPNTRRGREPLFPYDHKLERTLCNINRNLGFIDDYPKQNIPAPVYVNGQLLNDALVKTNRVDKIPLHGPKNTTESNFDGPLVFPPLPPGHTFVVTSSLMQILTARGLFSGLPSKDPHAHIAKVREVCKSCVKRPDLERLLFGSLSSFITQFSLGTN